MKSKAAEFDENAVLKELMQIVYVDAPEDKSKKMTAIEIKNLCLKIARWQHSRDKATIEKLLKLVKMADEQFDWNDWEIAKEEAGIEL